VAGYGIVTVWPDWKTRGTEPPLLKLRRPVWPSRSGRRPNVMEIDGSSPTHNDATPTPNRLMRGIVVVVVEGDVVVLVGGTEEVVVEVDDVDVVVLPGEVVVVVPPPGRHCDTSGSGPPSSKPSTNERPWASAKNEPMATGQLGIEWMSTEIGF
jgi:hypothetical protein